MVTISGILKDGAGQIINDCTIELYAKKTTGKVLAQTQAFTVASDGKYSMNVLPCEYDVSLIINGFPKKRIGNINVYSDSVDGTLNDYLINPEESDLTPEFLKQVIDVRNEAKKSADSANLANISETNAKSSADAAKASADEAATSSQLASKSAITATDAASVATTSSDTAKIYADNANNLAKEANQSAINSANSAKSANTSEVNAKSSEIAAKNSADNAKEWASTVDNSNFIKKSGDEKQCINGKLDVNLLTENGYRVFSLNNSDIVGAFRLMPFRAGELPFGWYFRNGDNYLLHSPQGQVLNRLSDNYKRDHQITIKDINGQQYINVPSAFASDGRGYFERPANGNTRQVGSVEGDAIRNIYGQQAVRGGVDASISVDGDFTPYTYVFRYSRGVGQQPIVVQDFSCLAESVVSTFDASRVVPTAYENRPINIGLTPAIYLGV